jgi:hypothetical protein
MRRHLLTLIAALSLLGCVALLWLRSRSDDTTDVFMLALPGNRCVLFTSHEGGWIELTWTAGWPDRGMRHWAARERPSVTFDSVYVMPRNSWEVAGPYKFWQNAAASTWGPLRLVHGRLAVPADDSQRLPAYVSAYDRALGSGLYAGIRPGDPRWLMLRGWEIRLPHTWAILATAVPPVMLLAVRVPACLRRRRRARLGQCPRCGYDLRSSPGKCPECGAESTAGQTTAPSSSKPSDSRTSGSVV